MENVPAYGRGLELSDLIYGPYQPKSICDSMINYQSEGRNLWVRIISPEKDMKRYALLSMLDAKAKYGLKTRRHDWILASFS